MSKGFYIRNDVMMQFGIGFVLYGFGICIIAYFPSSDQRGSLITTLLPWANVIATVIGYYIALATTYIAPNQRRGTPAARFVYAPLLMLGPLFVVLVGYLSDIWPSSDILLGMAFVALGVSILRIFVTTAKFDDDVGKP